MNRVTALILWVAIGAAVPVAQAQDAVTFTRDVAPVFVAHCAGCHRPEGSAPFSLLTYEEVRPRATRIAEVVSTRAMPPWKPEPGHGRFKGARRLADMDIQLIRRWVAQGARRGNPAEMPGAPPRAGAWQLGTPDLVVGMPAPYLLPPDERDVFRTFVVPIPSAVARYVRAVEFDPGNHAVVHHANIKIDRTPLSRRRDAADPAPGYDGGGSREAAFPDGTFLGWTPGQSPRISIDDVSWRLEPGSDLVLELHLMPGREPEPVQARVGLYFTDRRPARTAYMLRLGRQDLDIAAGQRDFVSEDAYRLPVDVDALAVQPHAHFLARQIRAWAALPDGTTVPLISIPDWDFHWQDVYTYEEPVALPKGTVIHMRYVYDNSAANPRNPNSPPARVTFGQTSRSEMGSLWLQVVPRRMPDLAALDRDFSPRILREDIAGNEKWLEVEPANPQLRAELAACYLEAGRLDAALAELVEAARLDPSAGRHYDVGRVLLLQERYADAERAFERALDSRPGFGEAIYGMAVVRHAQGRLDEAIALYGQALAADSTNVAGHYNLGRALSDRGDTARAIESYLKAIELAPEDADAHHGLARAFAMEKQTAEALYRYRRTLEIEPDRVGALLDLAWIIATTPELELRVPSEAVRLAERAVALTGGANATALDTLAAAYSAAGRREQAVRAAEDAVQSALDHGDSELAAQIRARLERYRSQ